MNATLQAQRAYAPATAPLRTPKSLEYNAIARVTHKLKQGQDRMGQDFPSLVRALEQNRKLWQIFATEVASDQNGLPQALRAQIFSLAEFTFAHTRQVLNRKTDASDLIEINTAIMRGTSPSTRVTL